MTRRSAPPSARTPGLEYLELLARGASVIEFEAPVLDARAAGADQDVIADIERAKSVALQVRAVLESRRRRESELAALYETASDLAALNHIDDVLTAIVRRAKQLLHSDVTYLSMNDDAAGDTYMRVTEGSTSAAFQRLRLPMGAGLGGLVAQTATPYATASYFDDQRFAHTGEIDSAVLEEGLVSIFGVPLLLGRRVIGVLYAANRSRRPFTREDVALLVSLAAHAAIAIDNARLLTETQLALSELELASAQLQAHTASVERAADAHDRLTAVVLRGGGVEDVTCDVAEVLGGDIVLVDVQGSPLASTLDRDPPAAAFAAAQQAIGSSRTADQDGACAAPVVAGSEALGALVLLNPDPPDGSDRRILERAALVTALLLLFRRSVADAEGRLRGEFLEDLLDGGRTPAELTERARHLGAELARPHVVVVAEVDGDRARVGQAASFLASTRHGFCSMHRGRLVIVLPDISATAAAAVVTGDLRQSTGAQLTAGVAGPASGPDAIVSAHAEAGRVLESLLGLGRHGDAATADDLGFIGLLLADRADVEPYVASTLGPVLDYDDRRGTQLVQTLEAYFASGRNIARTAASLHVHGNTVTQRLDRVGRLLGAQWQEPQHQLETQLALRLNRLRGRG